ncbi:hypothetical protein H9Y04_03480 [Streptomyces sp. TRM66268-LWL]|uniref:Integral membrane protein n=1 Tax=Streptomyces polyasparticus TaxID=2767826 RepID=A0ABR7SAI1_9ACTN|nr:hypothetical protein [Streptomyces polyasparticus]MBC9711627.1 hypothetical protein [Streptomyces polyasparticus]
MPVAAVLVILALIAVLVCIPGIRTAPSGLVGGWALSVLACVPVSYVWGRAASPWGPANEELYQGAESNELWVVAPYAVPRFAWLALMATAVWLYGAYRHTLAQQHERSPRPWTRSGAGHGDRRR